MLTLQMPRSASFKLNFRVPRWARDVAVKVNGAAVNTPCKPGTWAVVDRQWNSGDRVEIRIPLRVRMEPVDKFHPDRVAIMRGPVAMALDYDYHEPAMRLPDTDEELVKWMEPEPTPAVFRLNAPGPRPIRLKLRPLYAQAENFPFALYFDRKVMPYKLW